MSTISYTIELECQNSWTVKLDYGVVNYQFELDSYNVYSYTCTYVIILWILSIIMTFHDFEIDDILILRCKLSENVQTNLYIIYIAILSTESQI